MILENYDVGTQSLEATEIAVKDSDIFIQKKSFTHRSYNQTQIITMLSIYIISIAFILFTPNLAKVLSVLFSDLGYGSMTPMFEEIICAFLWAAEISIVKAVIGGKIDKNIFITKKEAKGQLPLSRLFMLIAIAVACVAVISAQINWQVKLFYDVGSNTTGYELMQSGGALIKNAIKCLWIVFLIAIGQAVFENFSNKTFLPAGGILLMLTLGAFDLAAGITLMRLTYVLLYAVFGWIFLITEKNILKTYLITWFIFVF